MAGAFHGPGEPDCEIHVGVSGPGAVRAALAKLPKDAPIDEVAELVKRTAFKIIRVGQLVANLASKALGVPAGIIDLSLAPTPAVGDSVANILEEMGLETRQDSFFEKSHLNSYSIRNQGSVLMSMVERSMSFHLISSAVQMGNCGWLETMSRIRVCPIIRLNAWTKFRCLSREREDTVRCLNWKTRTRSWISIVM